jgi:hypothetical protein
MSDRARNLQIIQLRLKNVKKSSFEDPGTDGKTVKMDLKETDWEGVD